MLRLFLAHDGEHFLDDCGQRPRGVRPAGLQAVAREPDGVEQFQRDQDVRRQFEFRDVVLLLVEVVQERVVGRA